MLKALIVCGRQEPRRPSPYSPPCALSKEKSPKPTDYIYLPSASRIPTQMLGTWVLVSGGSLLQYQPWPWSRNLGPSTIKRNKLLVIGKVKQETDRPSVRFLALWSQAPEYTGALDLLGPWAGRARSGASHAQKSV